MVIRIGMRFSATVFVKVDWVVKVSWGYIRSLHSSRILFTHLINAMVRKGKGRGKKTSISKQLQSTPSQLNSPLSPGSQDQLEEQQLDESNASELQNPVVLVKDNASGQAENTTNADNVALLHSPPVFASDEPTTSFGSVKHGEIQEPQELEVGLNHIASYSKNIPIFCRL